MNDPREASKSTTHELHDALEDLVSRAVPTPLADPIGCNVKWNVRDYHWLTPEACNLVHSKQ